MTISLEIMDRLSARSLDVELIEKLGFDSTRRGDSECLIIPFVREGKIVRRKYRRWDAPEGEWKWNQDKNGQRIAFNEDCLRDQTLNREPLIITEGEFDAVAALQSGFLRTISVPDGAPPPGDRSREELDDQLKYAWVKELAQRGLISPEHTPTIILATDGDENGAALLQDLSILLGRARCKFLTYPVAKNPEARGRPRLKDLNEVLEDYGIRGVRETIARATWIKISGVSRLSEMAPRPKSLIYDIGFDAFSDHFKLRMGDVSVFTGLPSSGKTTLVQDIVCRVTSRYALTAAWASFEQAQDDHRRAFREWYCEHHEFSLTDLQKMSADAWVDSSHVFVNSDEDEDPSVDWLLEKFETAIVRYGAKICITDPWNEVDHTYQRGMTEAQYGNWALRKFKRFARAYQVHMIIIAHPTKLQRQADGNFPIPTLYDINGGAVWYNKADLGVVCHRIDDLNTRVQTAKSRYHDVIGRPGAVIMQYCGEDRHFRETERVTNFRKKKPDPTDPDRQWPPQEPIEKFD